MNELVSVIMPCYNAEKYVKAAIQSILAQTYKNFELIIIDDASSDKSVEYIREFCSIDNRLKLLLNDVNRGISYSRNRGIANSRGKYIALMDADDICYKDRLFSQVHYLENNKDIDAVSGYYDFLDEAGRVTINQSKLKECNPLQTKIKLLFECIIADSSTICRKEILIKNNIVFPEDYKAVGGYKFWCEFALYGKIAVLPVKYYQYRINMQGLTQITKRNNREERYLWHDRVHRFYWEAMGLRLSGEEESVVLQELRGCHIQSLKKLLVFHSAMKKVKRQARDKQDRLFYKEIKQTGREVEKRAVYFYMNEVYHKLKRES